MSTDDPVVDGLRMREVLGHHPTGVAIVTAPGDPPVGLAVGSFTSVSLDPPLVGFFVDRGSSTWPRIEAAGAFCANVVGDHQEDLCRLFATKGADRFASCGWRPGLSGAPRIDDSVAWIDCRIDRVVETGDHQLVLGRVLELDLPAAHRTPLVFHRGGYGGVAPLGPTPPGPTP